MWPDEPDKYSKGTSKDWDGSDPLDSERKQLESILMSLPVGVITIDRHWHISAFNLAAEEITGYRREEVLGRPCYKIFRTPVCQKDCPMEKALSCGSAIYDREVAFINRHHRQIMALVNATPLYDGEGKVIGGVETLRDMSPMMWMRHELMSGYSFENIIGRSTPMVEVFRRLYDVSQTNTTVLIIGESGTGKELVARAIHFTGGRKDRPFVGVNCSALPEGILESELFGHVKGAFTGAIRNKIGRFEMANGGTFFLDEVAELSPSTQVKLLRVLEQREFQRVGDSRNIRVDIRLIAATNKDLQREVSEGRFRDDLYYRLNVYPIHLPPLRDRIEDLPLLIDHFVDRFNHQMGRRIRGLSGEAVDALYAYHWPGNVRELENAIEHAFVHSRGVLIRLKDLPRHIEEAASEAEEVNGRDRQEALGSFEKRLILHHLENARWKRRLAAQRLGISPVTLWRKMKKYGIRTFPS